MRHFFYITQYCKYLQSIAEYTYMNLIIEKLLPRRREVYETVKNHPYITFDSLSRRFVGTPKRTLAYDLEQLVKAQLVIKHGVTRGVCYSVPKTLD